jgi:hypothetical protein
MQKALPVPLAGSGSWTYRSFINDPDISKDFNVLEFGRGELIIEHLAPGIFAGRLSFGDTYQFRLSGWAYFDFPASGRFQGTGDTQDSFGQVYDYVGFFVPMWANGANQRPALLGSIVCTVLHSGGFSIDLQNHSVVQGAFRFATSAGLHPRRCAPEEH